jgi:hypothetical protein
VLSFILSLLVGAVCIESSTAYETILEVFNPPRGLAQCEELKDQALATPTLKSLQTHLSERCAPVKSLEGKNPQPSVQCCSQLAGGKVSAGGARSCGTYDPKSHEICLWYNAAGPLCGQGDASRVAETLWEESWHAYQECSKLNRELDQELQRQYRQLPFNLSELSIETPFNDGSTYRCSQIDTPTARRWCLELNAKTNNPYREGEEVGCEDFCSSYAKSGWQERGCCKKVCAEKQASCKSWIQTP